MGLKRIILPIVLLLVVLNAADAVMHDTNDPNLVGYWKLDETSGTIAVDSKGGDNNGTIVKTNSTVSWGAAGVFGSGVTLGYSEPNADGRIVVPLTGMRKEAGTVAFWAKIASDQGPTTSTWRYFVGWQGSMNPSFQPGRVQIYLYPASLDPEARPNSLSVGLGDRNQLDTRIKELSVNEWYHIALTWQATSFNGYNGNYKLYVDGIDMPSGIIGSGCTAGTYKNMLVTADYGDIGNHRGSTISNPEDRGIVGTIDEVGFYNAAISREKICMLASADPNKAWNPLPDNGEVNQPVSGLSLSWSAGAGATSHDVYFGTVSPGVFQRNQPGTTFDPGTLNNSTTYYWRINEKNAGGTTTGDVWRFTTIPAPLTLLTPNGGEVLTTGTTYDVNWTSTGSISSVKIEYSSNNGGTWNDVNTVPNSGSYDWLVPAVNSNRCLVRVSDASNPSIVDTSDAVFTIKPPIGGSVKSWGEIVFDGDALNKRNFTAIAAGWGHSLALKSDGSIVGWGRNFEGQAAPPAGNNYISIAAGWGHSLALKSDGTIVGWGNNEYGQATPPAGNNYVAIAAGTYHSLALKSDGTIVGWGAGKPGQTDWPNYGQAAPPAGNNYVSIAAGGYHSLALKSDGSIVGWGESGYGQATPPAGNYVAIAAGYYHSIALKSDGSIVGFGYNASGQATPPAGNNYIAITAGEQHNLALKSDGTIVGWGNNDYGQAIPPTGNNFVAIAAGETHSIALRSDGTIVGWGNNYYVQAAPPAANNFIAITGGRHSLALKSDGSVVGWGENFNGQATPPAGNDYVAIAAGYYYSLALKSDGSIVGWGGNDYGQATPPAGNYVAIAAGQYHSLSLKSDGSIVGWGRNNRGQATPPAGNNYVAIAAGGYHSLALKSDGSIVGWGDNGYGQATPPAGNNFIAIAAGYYHSLALKSDGSIVAWGAGKPGQTGWPHYGQATPPAGNNYVAIAAGGFHSLALKSDGSIVCWGDNSYGQAAPPAGGNYVSIAAGYYHSLALMTATATKPKLGVINKERIDRTRFVYGCDVTFTNLWGFAVKNVELKMMQGSENMTIIEPNVTFGDIEFKMLQSITSTDTCTFIVDRAEAIDPNMIIWRIGCKRADTGMSIELTLAGVGFAGFDNMAGDITGDGKVDYEDLGKLAAQWLQTPGIPSADIAPPPDGDGVVDFQDFAEMANHWLE
jgi:alpha-tubulin suppressor-like RCC1 family protein